jgi:hypothetical protein
MAAGYGARRKGKRRWPVAKANAKGTAKAIALASVSPASANFTTQRLTLVIDDRSR